jgi:protein-L-isoaspartate O-methyltransferase
VIEDGKYIGKELELFEKAHHWKAYYGNILKPYLKGDVLEVGAGIGGTTTSLCDGLQKTWLCLEPDEQLASHIQEKIDHKKIPSFCEVKSIYSNQLNVKALFNAILYMDVIEHIEHDDQELMVAYRHLKPGGALIVLVPAHQCLYTSFDKKIGHFRRYSKKRLQQAVPKELKKEKLLYLDSVGLSASLANKLLLHSPMPNEKQIKVWDNYMIPLSRFIDPIFGYTLGKSVLGVWKKS